MAFIYQFQETYLQLDHAKRLTDDLQRFDGEFRACAQREHDDSLVVIRHAFRFRPHTSPQRHAYRPQNEPDWKSVFKLKCFLLVDGSRF